MEGCLGSRQHHTLLMQAQQPASAVVCVSTRRAAPLVRAHSDCRASSVFHLPKLTDFHQTLRGNHGGVDKENSRDTL